MQDMARRIRALGPSVRSRFVTVLAITVIALGGLTACSAANNELLSTQTANVSINGQDTPKAPPVRCSQVRWLWTIETLKNEPGFTAMVQTGDSITAKLVKIRDLGGFTGVYYQDTVGDAQAHIKGFTYTISGTAYGFYADNPSKSATADFRIQAKC